MAFPSKNLLHATLEAADEAGVKLEMVAGLPIWEAMPGIGHQKHVRRIESSISRDGSWGSDCGCQAYSDVIVQFDDGSYKRPDISIFCREPDEQEGAVTLLPEAVVEVVSRGYEAKDYEIGLPFYLKIGVKDVIIFDPARNHVLHARSDATRELAAPVTIHLACGCVCSI
jgi:Uma2 family endonuclease